MNIKKLSEDRKFVLMNAIEDELYDTLEDENEIEKQKKKLMKLMTKNEFRNIEKKFIEYQNDFTSINVNDLFYFFRVIVCQKLHNLTQC